MGSSRKYLVYLVWVSAVFSLGIYIFTSGFLLQRRVLSNQTICKDRGCNQPPTVFKKAIIIIIDALKYEFCDYKNKTRDRSSSHPLPHHVNQLPVINRLMQPDPDTGQIHGQLYRFMADPPTTTMQRLKGLTTGGLPTFIDVSANFASYSIQEDSLINQFNNLNKSVYFSGDDTWMSLYPDSFKKSDPAPSFDVWDLDSVDNQVNRFLKAELPTPDWDVMIGHFLGVDHAGHKFGPNHPEMGRKLREMNSMIESIVSNMPPDTALFVFGDHGMTSSGDHGGDSIPEVEAGLFVYGRKFGFSRGSRGRQVSQIDIVPSISLLLGIPVPFSNLGGIIEDLFIPTMLLKENDSGLQSRLSSFSKEDLVKFRMSYMKANVNQVYRYLTAYLSAGGHFPERANSRLRKLASEVINRPGALSPRETLELYKRCKEFLDEAKEMCQKVWVNFDDQAITIGLTMVVLHVSILSLLLCKPQTRLLSTLISGFLLICIGASILVGSLFGATISIMADWLFGLASTLPSMELLILYGAGFFTLIANGMGLIWKFRYCIEDIYYELWSGLCRENIFALFLFAVISVTVFSNSFVVKESSVLCFCFVSLLLFFSLQTRKSRFLSCLILLAVGLVRLSCLYIRCREEDGPDCVLTHFHKPLSTLDTETGFYRNWRYFFTLVSLLFTCISVHSGLSSAGNLNGITCPVLTALYLPGIIATLMASYWALQSFPLPVVAKLLPWQYNLTAHLVFGLAALGVLILVWNPRLVYFQRRATSSRVLTRQDNIPSYFNYIRTNWRLALQDKTTSSLPLGYGLGSCISAPYLSICVFFLLVSMLIAGDGQCPAVLIQFLLMLIILVVTSASRLKQIKSITSLLRVPYPTLVLWLLLDYLTFFTTGHQATFPHIQWSAAFIGMEGSQLAGESYTGHIVPALLIGWNTFSSCILSSLFLPLLLVAPLPLYLLLPPLRVTHTQHTNGTGAEALLSGSLYYESDRGESVLLDKPEDTKSALLILIAQYILLKGVRLCACMLAAAVLRRHLMVWKIFAPRFIFEGVGFFVTLASLLLAYLIFVRILNVVSSHYAKYKIS